MKIKLNIFLLAILVVFMASCEDDTRNLFDGPSLVHFAEGTAKIFVADSDDPQDNVAKVRVGVTRAENRNRTVQIGLSGTAVAGEHFSLESTSVVIPAGEYFVDVPVRFNFDAFGDEEVRVVLTVEGGDIDKAAFNQSFVLRAERYCETIMQMFVGSYLVHDVSQYDGEVDPYVVTVTYNPEDGNMLTVSNLWEFSVDVKIALKEPSFSNFEVEIPQQEYFEHATHGQAYIAHITKGTYNPCNFQIEISYAIFVEAGFFDRVISSVWTRIE